MWELRGKHGLGVVLWSLGFAHWELGDWAVPETEGCEARAFKHVSIQNP